MATKRKKPVSKPKRKSSKSSNRWIVLLFVLVVLFAIALFTSYLYLKIERSKAPELSEIQIVKDSTGFTEFAAENPTTNPALPSNSNLSGSDSLTLQKITIKVPGILEGTWVNTMNGAMFTIENDHFSIDFPSIDSHKPMKGILSINNANFTLIQSEGGSPCGSQPGEYSFEFNNGDLVIKKTRDMCDKRAEILDSEWFKL